MNQIPLLKDHAAERKNAVEADIYAAGGYAAVGVELGLSDDTKTAATLLNNKVNRNGRHRLSDDELWQIKQWARERKGVSRVHELESDALKFEGKWLTSEEIKAQKRQRTTELLKQLIEHLQEDDE